MPTLQDDLFRMIHLANNRRALDRETAQGVGFRRTFFLG
jgi:hypothetical protein